MNNITHTLPFSFFTDLVIEGDIIYCPLANYNAVCKGNLANNQLEIIDILPGIAEDKGYACTGIYKIGNNLLLYEYDGDGSWVYDILGHKFSKLSDDKNLVFLSDTVFEKEDYLYIVSIRTAEVYKFDLQKHFLQSFTCKESVPDNVQMGNIIRHNDWIYIPLYHEKKMLIFDLDKEKYECYQYPENISGSYNLAYRGDELWIIGEDRKIYTWNIKEGKADLRAEFPDEIEQYISEPRYVLTFIDKNALWIFPASDKIIKYDIQKKRFEILKICEEESEERQYTGGYDIVKNINDKAFLLSSQKRVLYEIDLLTNDIQKHYFPIVNTFNGRLYPIPTDGKMLEKNYFDMIDALVKSIEAYNENSAIVNQGIVGKKINEYLNNDSIK